MPDALPGISDEALGHMERLATLMREREVLSIKVSLEVVESPSQVEGFYGMTIPGTRAKRRLMIEYEV